MVHSFEVTKSSNVKRITYNDVTFDLGVEFLSGGVYVYKNVPPIVFEQAKQAPSVGSFLHRNVKNFFKAETV